MTTEIETVVAPVVEAPAAPVAETSATAPMADVAKLFEAPIKSMTEAQDKVRAALEKGLTETRANYAKVKSATDEATSALEASYATAKTGVAEINTKAIEALKATAEANFEFAKSVFAVKTISDFVALQTEFTRKQIEMLTAQSKDLGALAQKVANDSVEPIKAQVAKTFKVAV